MFKANRKTPLILGTVFILLATSLTLYFTKDPTNYAQTLTALETCQAQKIQNIETCQAPLLVKYAKAKGPALASKLLQDLVNTGKLKYDCHELSHVLGIYTQTYQPDKVQAAQTQVCGGGFLHGVFQTAAAKDSPATIEKIGLEICRFTNSESVQTCNHGIGHALNLAKVSLSSAGVICKSISSSLNVKSNTTRATQDIGYQCISGYVMQHALDVGKIKTVNTKDVNLPLATDGCQPLISQTLNYQFCMIAWSKEEVGVLATYQKAEAIPQAKVLAKFCASLPVDTSLTRIEPPGETTGSDMVDLCWNEIGSMFASNNFSYVTPQNSAQDLKNICGESYLSLLFCVRDFASIKRTTLGKDKDYAYKFCSSFDAKTYQLCYNKFLDLKL